MTDDTKLPSRRKMEPFDTLMYRSEDDPRSRSTLIGLFILDRAPDWDRVLEDYERVTRLILPLRQRVVEPLLPVTAPVWVIDPDFDLSYHLRRMRIPTPGTQQQLLALLEPMSMTPLDRARPLWECTLIEGLEDGAAAWVIKMNHAIADGVGGQALAGLAFDSEADPPKRELPPVPVPDDLTPGELARQGLTRSPVNLLATAARSARSTARLGHKIVRQPRRAAFDAAAYARSLRRIVGGPPVKPSPLMRRRSLRRRLCVLEVELDQLRPASKSAGGSLNDGFLAAVCGGMRLYHERLNMPIASVAIAMPISMRTSDDPAGGNRWAGARLALPVDEVDPGVRIRRIREQVLEARQEPAIDALSLLAPLAVRLPNWVLSTAAGSAGVSHDLQLSNVPGSPVPFYLAGAKVLKMFPFGPVPGPAAMITIHSYLGTGFIGVNLDPAAITEPALFMTCLEEGFGEVLSLKPPTSRRRKRST